MNTVYLQSIGVVAPGIANWPACRNIFKGDEQYQFQPIPRFNPDLLPVNERRRITPTIRLAMQAATEAAENSSLSFDNIATVFASSNGDLEISDRICNALTLPEKPVSPTDFHNSIHNAPAGYWSIGSRCLRFSTSVSAGDASLAAGLLDTVTLVSLEEQFGMLVAYDQPPPAILSNDKTVSVPFAVALVITQRQTGKSLAAINARIVGNGRSERLSIESFEHIRARNSTAEAFRLLDLAARNSNDHCLLPYLDGKYLEVDYSPC